MISQQIPQAIPLHIVIYFLLSQDDLAGNMMKSGRVFHQYYHHALTCIGLYP